MDDITLFPRDSISYRFNRANCCDGGAGIANNANNTNCGFGCNGRQNGCGCGCHHDDN